MEFLKRLVVFFILKVKHRDLILRSLRVSRSVTLGKGVEIGHNTAIDGRSKIGNYSYIGSGVTISASSLGNFCSIANNVTIGPGEHKLDEFSTSSHFYENAYDELTAKDCVLGHDVWVGVNAIVLRGVKIGNGAVIGANSLVTNNVPPYSIAFGSPAKIVRLRVPEELSIRLEKSRWWLGETVEAVMAIWKDLDGTKSK